MEQNIAKIVIRLKNNRATYNKQVDMFNNARSFHFDPHFNRYKSDNWPCEPRCIEMIISDVDNTIVDSTTGLDYVSDELAGAFHAFEEFGGTIALATGRSWSMLKPMANNIGLLGEKRITSMIKKFEKNGRPFEKWEQKLLHSYKSDAVAAVDGGSRIVNMDGQTLWSASIPQESVIKIIVILKELGLNSVFWSNSEKDFTRKDLERGWKLSDLDPNIDLYFLGVRCVGLSRDDVRSAAGAITSNVSGINIGISEAQYNPGFCDLHITNVNATKKNAAKEIMKLFKVNKNNVVAAGDGGNDIELFNACGVKYAVGNAVLRLKMESDVIGPSIIFDKQRHGIRKYIRHQEHGFLYLLNTINRDKCNKSDLV